MRRPSAPASMTWRARSTSGSSGSEHGLVVVELEDLHGPGRRCLQAQAAQHALVEVLLDDLDARAGRHVDVDRAGLLELAREGVVAGDGVVDLDPDEQRVLPHAGLLSASLDFMISGIWEISSATVIPASARRAIFSVAVSSLPSTIVPAWPKLMPGISSMKRPAMKATIGRRESCSVTQAASSASMRPPGSV